jgi:hypothetical protein
MTQERANLIASTLVALTLITLIALNVVSATEITI